LHTPQRPIQAALSPRRGADAWCCRAAHLLRRAAQEVNKVQLDIRTGHAQTVEKVLGWLQSEGSLDEITVCDVRPRAHSGSRARSMHFSALVANGPVRFEHTLFGVGGLGLGGLGFGVLRFIVTVPSSSPNAAQCRRTRGPNLTTSGSCKRKGLR
jgi:hypothetical protein